MIDKHLFVRVAWVVIRTLFWAIIILGLGGLTVFLLLRLGLRFDYLSVIS
jgi:hypothetical protein